MFPSKIIVFTEVQAKSKAIFRYPRTQNILKELCNLSFKKTKRYPSNQNEL